MHHWAEAILKRPVAILAWAVALLVGGSWAATEVPLEWVPKVELPEVRVAAAWPGASPRAVERYVTAPIERAAQAVEGTARFAAGPTRSSLPSCAACRAWRTSS